ncbi:FKBP-type peptidyl-prolyl cis-trans isomerase [Methyloterricola oryzae]|uniref:FKBP-type peptidyl-prolyl cis-trans isomerase n=1 Tax=Methyloterricola oryzae TaxID=1495050 RepID=UPI000AF9246C|nr:FKBP-type peptidyl-prolyl cis-trans isomerase [Methyloterricola oryzae]
MNKRGGLAALIAWGLLAVVTACTPGDPEQNKKDGAAYLAENAKKPGVVTTASGLQYQVLTEGSGLKPEAKDSVTVNYSGSLISGSEFDSGEGITFPLGGVIPGWTEGLQLMKEGAKYRFFIPPALAYGESGAGRVIPPNATLVFDVELVKVNR